MASAFNPYHRWLGIPPDEQPPDHYRLLGLPLFAAAQHAISLAADHRIAYLKTLLCTDCGDLAEQLVNEVLQARICLLDPTAKADYDSRLLVDLDLDDEDSEEDEVDDIDEKIASLQKLYADLTSPERRPRECSLPGPPGIPGRSDNLLPLANGRPLTSEDSEVSRDSQPNGFESAVNKQAVSETTSQPKVITQRKLGRTGFILSLLALGLPILACLILAAFSTPSPPNMVELPSELAFAEDTITMEPPVNPLVAEPAVALESPFAEQAFTIEMPSIEAIGSSDNEANRETRAANVADSSPETKPTTSPTSFADANDPWFLQLDAAYENGAYADIIKRSTARLATEPANARVYTWRGIGRYKVHRYDLAAADFTAAIRLDPDYANAHCWRAITLFRLRHLDWAIADCTEVIRIAPEHATAYCIRGSARFEKGDFAGAVADLTRAIELNPAYGKAYAWRAKAYWQLGQTGEAASDSAKAQVLPSEVKTAFWLQGR